MKIIDYKDIDFVNYKLPSLYIIMPYCSFKCDKECGRNVCQNSPLAKAATHNITVSELIKKFDSLQPLVKAVVFGGLEPFDSGDEFYCFVSAFRYLHPHPIVIYTGYTEDEVHEKFKWIYNFKNIIIKYGRFIPDQESHYDEVLGVRLASPNQYAKENK